MRKNNTKILPFYITSFLRGFDFIGPFFIMFYTVWGHITQTQILTIQTIFLVTIIIAEIPTGLVGDILGRKVSAIYGYILMILGLGLYGLSPNIGLFIVSEILLGVGIAFQSGAMEALLYDKCKTEGIEDEYSKINSNVSNLGLIGMILSSFMAIILIKYMSVNYLLTLETIPMIASLIIYAIFVKEPIKNKEELVPNYKEILKKSYNTIKNNSYLKKIILFNALTYISGYFTIWIYQTMLIKISVPDNYFSYFKVGMVLTEIILLKILADHMKIEKKARYISIVVASLTAFVFIMNAINISIYSIILFILIGSVTIQMRSLLSPIINKHIDSNDRSTTLSGISLLNRIIIAIINPFIGMLIDYRISIALFVISFASIISIFIFPKKENTIT